MANPTRRTESTPVTRGLELRGRGHSMAVLELTTWCADANRLVHLARRYDTGHPDAAALRRRLVAEGVLLVQDHAPFRLEVTPRSIMLEDEPVFVAEHANSPASEMSLRRELPWLLHRDGIRAITFNRGLDEREAEAFLNALLVAAPASATHEDMVTLIWEAEAHHITLTTEETDPLRRNVMQHSHGEAASPHVQDRPRVQAPATDLRRLWNECKPGSEAARDEFMGRWSAESARPFKQAAFAHVEQLLREDPRPETKQAMAAACVTWLATCVQRSDWREAEDAYGTLQLADPGARTSGESLAHAFRSVDSAAIVEHLDEADASEQTRLFAFLVHIGEPALPLLIAILAGSGKARVRAGATTALAYAFAERPAPLGIWLQDHRWHVVRNIVFVLGHIGGVNVVPHLAAATRHIDARVRRAAIHALGHAPSHLRNTVLLQMLDLSDTRTLSAALAMLTREPDRRVTESLLSRLRAPDFEARPEEQRLTLIGALADLEDETVVPTLEQLLGHGGWFARRTPDRTAAARALARVGSSSARDVLEQGLRHRSEAVREACEDALAHWGRA